MFLAMVSLTSCETEDEQIANTLWGTWEGQMNISYEYQGGYYQTRRTIVTFDKDEYEYASGTGYWIDCFDNFYHAVNFYWYVDRGIIYFESEEGDMWEIWNYSINRDGVFVGEFHDGYGSICEFSLYQTTSPTWSNSGWHSWTNARVFDNSDVMPVRRVTPLGEKVSTVDDGK